MDELIKILLTSLIGGSIPIIVIVLLVILNPEKVEKWISLIQKYGLLIFRNSVSLIKGFNKYDLQGRVNSFTKKLKNKIPALSSYKLKLEWINTANLTRKSFLDHGEVIIRLNRNDPSDDNFVHGAYTFVSQCMLLTIKRHISETQKITTDTFVTAELIKTEKPQIFTYFAENYLHINIDTNDKKKYFEHYQLINEHGYFFEVLMQELEYLGRKVMTSATRHLLIREYDEIINFLVRTSNRIVGDDSSDLRFKGQYTNMIIMIIGKSGKISNKQIYIEFLNKETANNKIETIYVLGAKENKKIIKEILVSIDNNYHEYHAGISSTQLNMRDGSKKSIEQYYVLLRKSDPKLLI